MSNSLTFGELASLMHSRAGITVDAEEMACRPDSTFAEYGLDALGLLGIVGELENRYGRPITAGAEMCKTPGEFVDVVNESLTAGA